MYMVLSRLSYSWLDCRQSRINFTNSAACRQPLPLAISVQHRQFGPTDPANPTIILGKVVLTLKQYHIRRVRQGDRVRDTSSFFATRGILSGKQLALDNTPIHLCTVNADGTDVINLRLADCATQPSLLVPSFITYTINMHYKLKITVSILHAETGHAFTFETKIPFTILPPNSIISVATNNHPVPATTPGSVDAIGVQLPSYSDAVSDVGSSSNAVVTVNNEQPPSYN